MEFELTKDRQETPRQEEGGKQVFIPLHTSNEGKWIPMRERGEQCTTMSGAPVS